MNRKYLKYRRSTRKGKERMRKIREGIGKCEICSTKYTEKEKLTIDHCHKTGYIRGVLCDFCNDTVGQIEETIKQGLKNTPAFKGIPTIAKRVLLFKGTTINNYLKWIEESERRFAGIANFRRQQIS